MAGMKSGVNGMAVSVGTITDPGRAKKNFGLRYFLDFGVQYAMISMWLGSC